MVIQRGIYLINKNGDRDLTARCLVNTITLFGKFQLLVFPRVIWKRTKLTLKLRLYHNAFRTTGVLNIT